MNSKEEWLKENSIKLNEPRMIKSLKEYGFEVGVGTNCQITNNGYNYDCDICLRYMEKSYRIVVDEDSISFNLLEENKASNGRNKNRYRKIKSFYGDTVIEDTLKYIKNSSTSCNIAC